MLALESVAEGAKHRQRSDAEDQRRVDETLHETCALLEGSPPQVSLQPTAQRFQSVSSICSSTR